MSELPTGSTKTALIVGTGLIGGSIGLALREQGWRVIGHDRDNRRTRAAIKLGAIGSAFNGDSQADLDSIDLVFVATPAGQIVETARDLLARTSAVITDVGSVKGSIAAALDDPRFVGGHPMAGSEQDGIDGARADLFQGATWVLTPHTDTSDEAYTLVRSAIASIGAEVLTLAADRHDELVAMVSHVPHLTAAALMRLAAERSDRHRALLRLAAGGFRDMTRVAAGNPQIWPDICLENRDAIGSVLADLVSALEEVGQIISSGDGPGLLGVLESARTARVNLPRGIPHDVDMVELRVPVLDRPGEIALITTLASTVDVNIYDIEIAHSGEGTKGVIILLVQAELGERLLGALMANDYRPSLQPAP